MKLSTEQTPAKEGLDMMLRPKDVKSEKDVLLMESDNNPCNINSVSLFLNNPGKSVSIHYKDGWLEIPKADFDAIIEWYCKPQKLRKES